MESKDIAKALYDKQIRNEKPIDDVDGETIYCDYLHRSIDEGLCLDIQMISNGYILPSALPDIEIDKPTAAKACERCPHKMCKHT